jgi:hypothetical protein
MGLRGLLQFRNPDSTADVNAKTSSFVDKGVFDAGSVHPSGAGNVTTPVVFRVPGQLSVQVGAFVAQGADGMVCVHEAPPNPYLVVTAGVDQYVLVKTVYNAAGQPDIQFEVRSVADWGALLPSEQAKRIILAKITLAAYPGATEVLDQYIDLRNNDLIDRSSRSFIRGVVAAAANLPVDSPTVNLRVQTGDVYLALAERQFYQWDGGTWQTVTDGALSALILGHIASLTAHQASAIVNVPAGTITSTDVQAALNELDTKKVAKAGDSMTGQLSITAGTTALFATSTGGAGVSGTGTTVGVRGLGGSGNTPGVYGGAAGTGDGVTGAAAGASLPAGAKRGATFVGKDTGVGVYGVGGDASGSGLYGEGGAPNGKGGESFGRGSGTGFQATGGATNGKGLRGLGTGTGVGAEGVGHAGATGNPGVTGGTGTAGIGGAGGGGSISGADGGTGGSGDVATGGTGGAGAAGTGIIVGGDGGQGGPGLAGQGGTGGAAGATGGAGAGTSGDGGPGVTGTGGAGGSGASGGSGVVGTGGAPDGNGVSGTGNGAGAGVYGTSADVTGIGGHFTATGSAETALQVNGNGGDSLVWADGGQALLIGNGTFGEGPATFRITWLDTPAFGNGQFISNGITLPNTTHVTLAPGMYNVGFAITFTFSDGSGVVDAFIGTSSAAPYEPSRVATSLGTAVTLSTTLTSTCLLNVVVPTTYMLVLKSSAASPAPTYAKATLSISRVHRTDSYTT